MMMHKTDELPERNKLVLAWHETGEIYHCRRAWDGASEVWAHAFVDATISDDRFTKWAYCDELESLLERESNDGCAL